MKRRVIIRNETFRGPYVQPVRPLHLFYWSIVVAGIVYLIVLFVFSL